jgi:hypothetical protein
MPAPHQGPGHASDEHDLANSEAGPQRVAGRIPRTREGDSPLAPADSSRLGQTSQLPQDYQIFVDPTGRRADTVRRMGYLVTGMCATYTIGLVLSLAGSTAATPGRLFQLPGVAPVPQHTQAEAKGPPHLAGAGKPRRPGSAASEAEASNGTTSNRLQKGVDNPEPVRRSAPTLPTAPATPQQEAPRPTPRSDPTDERAPKPSEPTEPPGPIPAEPGPVEPKPDEPAHGDTNPDQPPTDGGEAPGDGETPPPADGLVSDLLTPVGELLSDVLTTR